MAALLTSLTLLAVLVVGVTLIRSLDDAARTVRSGGRAVATLHGYDAALEVWRQSASGAASPRGFEAQELRDSIRAALTAQIKELRAELSETVDHALLDTVIAGLRAADLGLAMGARHAAIAFLTRQEAALLEAAEEAERATWYAVVLLALTVLAVGVPVLSLTSIRPAQAPREDAADTAAGRPLRS